MWYVVSFVLCLRLWFDVWLGKTMLVRATAKHFQVPILTISPGNILDKYSGGSEKRVRAAFAAAEKLKECIVFIDELDGLLRARRDVDTYSRELKLECMESCQ